MVMSAERPAAPKPKIAILEPRSAWRAKLQETLAGLYSHLVISATYDEFLVALQEMPFDLAIVDLWIDDAAGDADHSAQDSLEALLYLTEHALQTRLVVIGEADGREPLLETPGISDQIAFLPREQFSPEALQAIVTRHEDHLSSPISLGHTGVLISLELQPPRVGTRIGMPRVLIVEDQPFWLNLFARMLEEANYFWRAATTYAQALGRLRLESFHVVLLNPSVSAASTGEAQNWQLLDYLTRHCPRTKLIAISGKLSASEVAKLFIGYPIRGYVDKNSFDKNSLLSLIERQINKSALRVQTLGDFRLWRDGRQITHLGAPEAELLLKLLITRRNTAVPASDLLQCLAPQGSLARDFARLTETINAVRFALEPELPRPADSRLILREGASYRFVTSHQVEIDVDLLEQRLNEARLSESKGEIADAIRLYEQAIALYQGDYLPADRHIAWTANERAAVQALYANALNRIADLYAHEGDLDKAIQAANTALSVDAYAEITYRRLMRYHACKGDRKAAAAVYRTLVKLFSELFAEPISPLTQRLYEDIAADRPISCVEVRPGTGEFQALSSD
ncbi:MAG: hypothetical protein CUN49_08460 [Candidatus Thermofonsia Clade 1 bacterium]|uniref:Response regulatory domain-containing protein n=1 Tax=Candidatus Thermofonsia Clade 1 bacterium TaxID=2364210 RepID=A0A2M8PE73_9CHLR|nr:MAG: hypothetical protein CUN49_08460 [Candidatus Thermofonsia Clade 1 bacterium]